MALRILTYNIHGLPWIQCPIETILLWMYVRCECDVICLQEVFTGKLKQKILEVAPKYELQAFFPSVGADTSCFGKRFMRFENPSGLCILVKKQIDVLSRGTFVPFLNNAGVDRIVTKGYFSLKLKYNDVLVEIFNTHFQSDMTDIPCIRINYPHIRNLQEEQIYLETKKHFLPIVCGDFNKNKFLFFERLDYEHNSTFPQTGEHLDHLLLLHEHFRSLKSKKSIYFPEINLSDHIPVLFEFDFDFDF
jgi:exonuclease III